MPYVAPSTVVAGQTYSASAHNVIVNDVIDHESRIKTGIESYTTTERNALTGVATGTMIYNSTEKQVQVYNGSLWIEINDIDNTNGVPSGLAPFFSADWTDWTPVIRQNGVRTSTTNYARYLKIGTMVIANASVTITQAGSAGSLIECSLPVSAHATSEFNIGSGYYARASGTRYGGLTAVRYGSSANAIFQGYGVGNGFGADPSFATANNDGLSALFIYEAASP